MTYNNFNSDYAIAQACGRLGQDISDLLFGTGKYAPQQDIPVVLKSDYLNDIADKNILIAEQKQIIHSQQEVISGMLDDIAELQAHIAGLTAQLNYLVAENPDSKVFSTKSNVIGNDGQRLRTFEALFALARKKFFEKRT